MLSSRAENVVPLTEQTLLDVIWQSGAVEIEMIPLGFLCYYGMLQLDYNFPQEIIVGSKPVKIPNCHFKISVVQL